MRWTPTVCRALLMFLPASVWPAGLVCTAHAIVGSFSARAQHGAVRPVPGVCAVAICISFFGLLLTCGFHPEGSLRPADPVPRWRAGSEERRLAGLTAFCWCRILDHWPVRVRFADMARDVFFPLLLHVGIEVEVQLAVHNLPQLRVSVELRPPGDPEGAKAAILRHVPFRVCFEGLQVRFGGELVRGLIVRGRVRGLTNDGLAFCE